MTSGKLNQDDILSLLKALLVEKNYLSKKDSDSGTWPTVAQAAWESYAYHVLGESMHFMIPNSEQELTRLGIPYAVPSVPSVDTSSTKRMEIPVEISTPKVEKAMSPETKTLSRVINHDADSV